MCKQKQTITDNRSTLNAFPDKLVCVEAGKNKQTATKDCSTKDRCNFFTIATTHSEQSACKTKPINKCRKKGVFA